jgi:hypothetical protein
MKHHFIAGVGWSCLYPCTLPERYVCIICFRWREDIPDFILH